jgi:hypothetical protein
MNASPVLRTAVLVLSLALLPAAAGAQTIARSFQELQSLVVPGETVLLVDHTGREIPARVASISPSSLLVLTKERTRDARGEMRDTWTAKRLLFENDVQRVRRTGGHAVRNGALIGAGAAFGINLWFAKAYGENEGGSFCGGCLAMSIVTVPMGAGIGAGVGVPINRLGRKTIYLTPRPVKVVSSSPTVRQNGLGIVATVPF